jgi:O-antigen/teichoic acid export membrane protein
VNALEPTFSPRVARIYAAQGTAGLHAFVTKLQIGIAICMGVYAVGVSVFASSLLNWIYGPEYASYGWLLAVVSVVYTLAAVKMPLTMGLEAMSRTGAVFTAFVLAATVNLTFGIAAIALFDIKGLGAGLLLYMGTLVVTLWVLYSRSVSLPKKVASASPLVPAAGRFKTIEKIGVEQ